MVGESAPGLSQVGSVDEAIRFFEAFPTVVLVANSQSVDIGALKRELPDDTLFVFFNKTYKVLSGAFHRPSLLIARSGVAGANIVHRREVDAVLAPLRGEAFRGVLNLAVGGRERASPPEAFGRVPVGRLDLAEHFAGFYPPSHLPTSGFALAVFLAERCAAQRTILAGFDAQRSTRWKLFHDHDWTFEQVVLRILFAKGKLEAFGGRAETNAFASVCARFPDIDAEAVSMAASEVLAERLESANNAIDALISVTRPQQRLRDLVRSLKPASRKERIARSETGKG